MTGKEKERINKQVDSFIEEVGLYSDEHINYIEKLNNVLDEMKNSANSAERKNYHSFYETVKSFEHYLQDKKIVLTPHEKERLTVIVSSGLNNMARKRMAEDLIHAVKERHTSEVEQRLNEEKKKKEIAELKKSRSFFVNWYNLLKFSLEYGSITLFTHRLKAECFDRLRVHAYTWFVSVKPDLKKCLDKYYFYLSVLEYNSIAALYEFGSVLEEMRSVAKKVSYSCDEINELMNSFSSLYIAVFVNVRYIDSGLKKIFKEQNPGHGFWGFIGLLTDRPIVNGRPVRYSYDEMVSETIRGVLFSYYTTYSGVAVKTMNQLIYLTGDEGVIDSHEKELTEEAKKDQASRETREQGETTRSELRLSEISDLVGTYRDEGISLAVRIFAVEAKGNLSQWNREAEARPFFRVIKVLDGLKRYIVEMITDSSSLILIYDDNEYRNYFSSWPEVMKAAADFAEFAGELQGSREKDISGLRLDSELEKAAFVKRIMSPDMELPGVPGARALRETLINISAKCYNLCMRFNDLINRYNQNSKTQSSDLTRNYDFFYNAKIRHPKVRGFEIITNRRDSVLADLVKSGCSICEFISEQLQHPGIKAVHDEVFKLREEAALRETSGAGADTADSGEVAGQVKSSEGGFSADIYSDRVTKIKNWAYFEDFILPEFYDEKHLYRGGEERHIFCMEISNLSGINRKSGHESGDIVYRAFCQLIQDSLKSAGDGNVALRGAGGIVIGYITGIPVLDAVDITHGILRKMSNLILKEEIKVNPEPVINAAVYSEFPGTEAMTNIEIVKKIMMQASDGVKGHVAFLKHPEQMITEKDLDRRGYLKGGLISVVSE